MAKINVENTVCETVTIIPYLKPTVKLAMPDGPPFICGLCGHSSETKARLATHRHRKHREKAALFECDKCRENFSTKKQYEKHLKRPSCSKYPEYTCEYCSKKIIGFSNYNIHMRFHKKIYPFVCHLCEKGFMMTAHLKAHIETSHENKRFVCEEPNCDKFFKSQHSLKTHMYVHMDKLPYRCEYCEKMFPNKGRLNWHLKKDHNLKLTLPELDRMLVGEEISIKAKVEAIKFE